MKTFFKRFFPFILLLLFYTNGISQQNARLRRLTLEDGLSQSSIHQLFQDSEGFVWIATEDGLNRYDGYQFTVYRQSLKNKQSISNNWINAIAEDKEGNIWVGTKHGLNRWNKNSNNFTSFLLSDKSEIRGLNVHKLHYSTDDKLWFVHENGIGYYDFKTKKIVDYSAKYNSVIPAFKGSSTGCDLLEDGEKKIWYTTRDSGAVVFKNGVPQKIVENDGRGLLTNQIWHAIVGSDGEVWMTSVKGVMHYKSKQDKFSSINNDKNAEHVIPFNDINSVLFEDENNVWIVMYLRGIVKINLKTKEQKYYKASSHPDSIAFDDADMSFKDNEGNLWFFPNGRNAAVSIFNPKTNRFKNYKNDGKDLLYGLPATAVSAYLLGRNGEVWIGSDGISIYNPRLENFKHVTKNTTSDSTLENSAIWHIIKDSKNRTWVATKTGLNLQRASSRGFVGIPLTQNNKQGLSGRVNYFYEDKNNRFWIATTWGLYSYNEKENIFKKINFKDSTSKAGYSARRIYENKKGEICIVYSLDKIAKMNEEESVLEIDTSYSFIKDEITAIKSINEQLTFYGLSDGFYIYNEITKSHKKYNYRFGDTTCISNPEVTDALVQNDSIIWIATANGLNKFNVKTEKFKYYFIEDGLPNQFIYNLLRDTATKNIWMSTNKGISMFNPANETFRNYDVTDGLQSNEFNGGAAYTNGREFFFGGINGYNYFIPAEIKINTQPPLLYFSDLSINNKKVVPDDGSAILEKRLEDAKSITLNEGIVSLAIDFVALDFTNANAISYFYTIDKIGSNNSSDWYQVVNQRSVNITNPEHGDYLLKIKAVNKDGIESEIKQLEIHILPPFYKTIWFKLLVAALFILFIYLIYRNRIKTIKKQKKQLERLVDERTREVVEQRDEAEKQKRIAIQQKEEVAIQKEIVEIKNKEIIDSIHYAKRIQVALLKSEEHESKHLPSHFILFKPKDIVSGDFYWALEKQEHLYVTAADCTGHGVPGAFMSMLGIAFLNEINAGDEILSPSEILDQLRDKIVENLATGEKADNKDGMDMSLYKLNMKTHEIEWAGSNNPIWIIANNLGDYENVINETEHITSVFKKNETDKGGLIEIKPDKQSIGYNEFSKPFTNHSVKLQKNDSVYIFTDGFADQFGGEKGKKFKYKSLKELTLDVVHLPMEQQKVKMDEVFEKWRGQLEQIDDVCLIGLKL